MTTPWQLYQHARLLLRYTPQGIQITLTLSIHLITGIINRTQLWVACCFFLKHILFLKSKVVHNVVFVHVLSFHHCLLLTVRTSSFYTQKHTLMITHTSKQTHYTKHIEFPMMKTRASPWKRHSTSPFHSACFKRWEDGRQQERKGLKWWGWSAHHFTDNCCLEASVD